MTRKKLLSLLLCLLLAFSLAVPGMAAAPWYAEAQEYASQNGLLSGDFDPQAPVTMGAVLDALFALEGKPTINGKTVSLTGWAGATMMLEDASVLSSTALRGDMKEIFEFYARSRHLDQEGLMLGDETGNLNADKPLTQAELAQVLLRLSQKGAKTYTDITDLQILATSDLHGKFYPWNYALNAEDKNGSMAQLATAIRELRTDVSLLVDAGDTIQDNSASLFLDEPVHPMVQAINAIGYDVWVTGNHEYNYGMDTLRKTIASVNAKVLTGNVIDENGKPIADGLAIFEKNGVKIGVIGMVTPNIVRWDKVNLAECTVNDPVVETRKLLDAHKDEADFFIAVMHMGLENEYGVADSGVTDLIKACPELRVVVASHDHTFIDGRDINDVLVVENKNQAQTLNEIHLVAGKNAEGCQEFFIYDLGHQIKDYAPDEALLAQLKPYHEAAVKDAESVIGKLEGGNLAPENEIAEIPAAQVMDTAMIDLIQEVQMYYTGAKVSAAALFVMDANLKEGDIHKSDSSLIYKYDNTLYKLEMTGAQLKKFMEWSAAYFNQYQDGDLTISFNPDIRAYNYDMFAGVNFEIDISKPAGERIVNLTWPDGTPVRDDESFVIAVNNYRANSQLLAPGTIYEEGDMPKLLETDVRGDVGGVRELIAYYIQEVKGGTITPVCDNNWKIAGNNWDEALHQKAVEQLSAGTLSIPASADGRTPNVKAITVNDLK